MLFDAKDVTFEELNGKRLIDVKVVTDEENDEQIHFATDDGWTYIMRHLRECCETVYIEDICGDINDLIGNVVLSAYCESNDEVNEDGFITDEIEHLETLWTFYSVSTIKGSVTIRWYGESNGYYGVEVAFQKIRTDEL